MLPVAGTHVEKLRMHRLLVISPLYYMRRRNDDSAMDQNIHLGGTLIL